MDAQTTTLAQPAPVQTTSKQPAGMVQMSVTNPAPTKSASRLRGGGAGKDCFLGCVGCCLCFECCEGCCDCIGDIICCPCELLC